MSVGPQDCQGRQVDVVVLGLRVPQATVSTVTLLWLTMLLLLLPRAIPRGPEHLSTYNVAAPDIITKYRRVGIIENESYSNCYKY